MLNFLITVLPIVAAVVMVYYIVRTVRSARRLARRMNLVDAGLQGRVEVGNLWQPPPECLHLEPFTGGTYREVRNVYRDTAGGRPVMVFDYQDVYGRGPDSTRRHFRVALFELAISAPRLAVRLERLVDAAARLVGVQDIEMESQAFNRRYRVQADDRRFAFDVLNPRAIQALLDCRRSVALAMGGAFLVVYEGPLDPEAEPDPRAEEELLDVGRDIALSVPSYVRDDRPPDHRATW
jgi:hypothetical protein